MELNFILGRSHLIILQINMPASVTITTAAANIICLEVRGEIIRAVLCCIVYWSCAHH